MLKKIVSVLVAGAACLVMAACSGANKDYAAVKKAQSAVRELESGRIIVTSTVKAAKTELTVTEFTFRTTSSGGYEYFQLQYDNSSKPVYCEYSDGEKAEQWLIGSGWHVIDPAPYSREKPHRYIQLLSTACASEAVESVEISESAGSKCYTVLLKPEVLNETLYQNGEEQVQQETLTITTDSGDNLVYYADAVSFLNPETQKEREVLLEMELSEANQIGEIPRPELRDYGPTASK